MPIQRIFEEVEAAKAHIENLSVQALAAELREHPDLLLLDIRELQERILLGSIPGAKHVVASLGNTAKYCLRNAPCHSPSPAR